MMINENFVLIEGIGVSCYALKFVCDEVQMDGISEYKFTKDEYYGYIMWQKLWSLKK